MDDLDLATEESKAIYEEIQQYVLDKTGLRISKLYISRVCRLKALCENIGIKLKVIGIYKLV